MSTINTLPPSSSSTAQPTPQPPTSIEAKLVVLGAQAVGKTSLVHRFVRGAFIPPHAAVSTVGASFLTQRVTDADSGTLVRLQIWDTAGQERFRSISRLYYRGANAAILCYDITSRRSFEEIEHWLAEIRANLPEDAILHIVGTKADLAAEDPGKRCVPFESVVAYAADHLYPAGQGSSISATPKSRRSSNGAGGLWGLEMGWDSCHEVSASTGEGVEEVFRVLTRRLVEQRNARLADEQAAEEQAQSTYATTGDSSGGISGDGFDGIGAADDNGYVFGGASGGSFRLGHGDKRRSWLGLPTEFSAESEGSSQSNTKRTKPGPCCGG